MTDKPAPSDPIIAALKAARKEQGLILRAVGRRIGRQTDKSVWYWESETRSPSLANLHQWAGALGYEITLKPRKSSEVAS